MATNLIERAVHELFGRLFDATLSRWKYVTSAGFDFSVSPVGGEILVVGGEYTKFIVDGGGEKLTLAQVAASAGIGFALPGEFISGGGATEDFISKGVIVHGPGQSDFAMPFDFYGPSCALSVSEALGNAGGSMTCMFIGINEALRQLIIDVMRLIRRRVEPLLRLCGQLCSTAVSERMVGGARGEPLLRRILRDLEEDVRLQARIGMMLMELARFPFRGAIVFGGGSFRVSNLWADVSVSAVVQSGVIAPWRDPREWMDPA